MRLALAVVLLAAISHIHASVFGDGDFLGLLSIYTGQGEGGARFFGEHTVDIFEKYLRYYKSTGLTSQDQIPGFLVGKHILIDLINRHPYSRTIKGLARFLKTSNVSLDTVLDVPELARIDRNAVTLDSVVDALRFANDLGERLHKAAAAIFERELVARFVLHLTKQKPIKHLEIFRSLFRFLNPSALEGALGDLSDVRLKDILCMLATFDVFPVVQAISAVFFDKIHAFASGLSRFEIMNAKPLLLFLAFHSLRTSPDSLIDGISDDDISSSCLLLLGTAITKPEVEVGETASVKRIVDFERIVKLDEKFPRFSTVCVLLIRVSPAFFQSDLLPISNAFSFALQFPAATRVYEELAIANAEKLTAPLCSESDLDIEFAKMIVHEVFHGVLKNKFDAWPRFRVIDAVIKIINTLIRGFRNHRIILSEPLAKSIVQFLQLQRGDPKFMKPLVKLSIYFNRAGLLLEGLYSVIFEQMRGLFNDDEYKDYLERFFAFFPDYPYLKDAIPSLAVFFEAHHINFCVDLSKIMKFLISVCNRNNDLTSGIYKVIAAIVGRIIRKDRAVDADDALIILMKEIKNPQFDLDETMVDSIISLFGICNMSLLSEYFGDFSLILQEKKMMSQLESLFASLLNCSKQLNDRSFCSFWTEFSRKARELPHLEQFSLRTFEHLAYSCTSRRSHFPEIFTILDDPYFHAEAHQERLQAVLVPALNNHYLKFLYDLAAISIPALESGLEAVQIQFTEALANEFLEYVKQNAEVNLWPLIQLAEILSQAGYYSQLETLNTMIFERSKSLLSDDIEQCSFEFRQKFELNPSLKSAPLVINLLGFDITNHPEHRPNLVRALLNISRTLNCNVINGQIEDIIANSLDGSLEGCPRLFEILVVELGRLPHIFNQRLANAMVMFAQKHLKSMIRRDLIKFTGLLSRDHPDKLKTMALLCLDLPSTHTLRNFSEYFRYLVREYDETFLVDIIPEFVNVMLFWCEMPALVTTNGLLDDEGEMWAFEELLNNLSKSPMFRTEQTINSVARFIYDHPDFIRFIQVELLEQIFGTDARFSLHLEIIREIKEMNM